MGGEWCGVRGVVGRGRCGGVGWSSWLKCYVLWRSSIVARKGSGVVGGEG